MSDRQECDPLERVHGAVERPAGPVRLHTRSPRRWKDGVRENFLALEFAVERGEGFHASLVSRRLGAAQLAWVSTEAHRVIRTSALAGRSERAYVKLFWQLGGASRIEQAGRGAELSPGDWTFYDTARPYTIDMDVASRFVVMLLPRDAFPAWDDLAVHGLGRGFRPSGPARVALGAALTALRDPNDYGAQEADAVVESIARLMLAAAQPAQGRPRPTPGEAIAQAGAYMVERIGDPDLTPGAVAAAMGVSRRTLYSWFEQAGDSPHAFIQQTRLERCRRALLDAAEAGKTITRIAFEHGFSDMAHFSRLFKATFGASPRDFRKRPGA